MNREKYLDLIQMRLKNYFELEQEKSINEVVFDLYGKYQMMLGRTFLSKKDIIDKFETTEYVLVKFIQDLTEEDLERYLVYLKELPDKLVNLHQYHKSTYINMVFVCEKEVSCNIGEIKRFKFDKIYEFYLKGFCEIRLLLVELPTGKIVTNKAGKHVKKAYVPFYKK